MSLSAVSAYSVTAVNSGGQAIASVSITIVDTPPTALTYGSTSAIYTKGVAIPALLPTNTGGLVTSYSVSPALPAGLTLNGTTGAISGTPTALSPQATYIVTATNSGGETTTNLSITVNDTPPTNLTYSTTTAVYTIGSTIALNAPTNGGGAVVTYSAAPSLSSGLILNPSTGAITGTPTSLSPAATYVVTATNSGGSASVNLSITVNDIPPSGLSYSSNPVSYSAGAGITPNAPSSDGGAIIAYTVSPPLPNGLILGGATGIIAGVPAAVVPVATYTVTATNTGGRTTALLSIAVVAPPPPIITAPPLNQTVPAGTAGTFAVTASGTGQLTYEWRRGSTPIIGANTSFLRTPPSAITDSGSTFSVVVRDLYGGAAASSVATLNVSPGTSATTTTPLGTARANYTATLLQDGRVLLVGGYGAAGHLSSAELFNPVTGTFSQTAGPLSTARYFHSSTLLSDGKVLIAGGANASGQVNTAELFDPATGTFSTTTSRLVVPRGAHTATMLLTGKVLLTGGVGTTNALDTAELFDPVTGTFTATGSMTTGRSAHTATLLGNGKVLIAAGANNGHLASAELYDPASATFSSTGALMTPRQGHTETLLQNGKVLFAGGQNGSGRIAGAEVFDPMTGSFSPTAGPMSAPRGFHTATLLSCGKVLLAAGFDTAGGVSTIEVYEPDVNAFTTLTVVLTAARYSHTATLLPNGKILLAAGQRNSVPIASAELFW